MDGPGTGAHQSQAAQVPCGCAEITLTTGGGRLVARSAARRADSCSQLQPVTSVGRCGESCEGCSNLAVEHQDPGTANRVPVSPQRAAWPGGRLLVMPATCLQPGEAAARAMGTLLSLLPPQPCPVVPTACATAALRCRATLRRRCRSGPLLTRAVSSTGRAAGTSTGWEERGRSCVRSQPMGSNAPHSTLRTGGVPKRAPFNAAGLRGAAPATPPGWSGRCLLNLLHAPCCATCNRAVSRRPRRA